MSLDKMRYEIHPVANENLTEIRDEILHATDNLAEAKDSAGIMSAGWCYGTAILDTVTGEIDWGT